jgi:hypothetical protein
MRISALRFIVVDGVADYVDFEPIPSCACGEIEPILELAADVDVSSPSLWALAADDPIDLGIPDVKHADDEPKIVVGIANTTKKEIEVEVKIVDNKGKVIASTGKMKLGKDDTAYVPFPAKLNPAENGRSIVIGCPGGVKQMAPAQSTKDKFKWTMNGKEVIKELPLFPYELK